MIATHPTITAMEKGHDRLSEWVQDARRSGSVAQIQDALQAVQMASALHGMPYIDYLRTPQWRYFRDWLIQRAGDKCQKCEGGMLWGMEVHHLTYKRRGWESLEDVMVLCRRCHVLEHAGKLGRHADVLNDMERMFLMLEG